jgi:hypothetical protein
MLPSFLLRHMFLGTLFLQYPAFWSQQAAFSATLSDAMLTWNYSFVNSTKIAATQVGKKALSSVFCKVQTPLLGGVTGCHFDSFLKIASICDKEHGHERFIKAILRLNAIHHVRVGFALHAH